MKEQTPLFDEPTEEPIDTDAAARHIAAHAPRVEYPDRTSEAARDQGWSHGDDPFLDQESQVAIDESLARHPSARSQTKRHKPTKESRHGDSERDAGRTPAGHETYEPPTDDEKVIGIKAIEQIRKQRKNQK